MGGFLFNEIVFGPVSSRRFGVSLGINLLPETMKYCTFNCVYCECGLTSEDQDKRVKLFPTSEILDALEARFKELFEKGLVPDNITYAGNGEPTIHPGFLEIIDRTIVLRDKYFPTAKITVLSNATRIHKENVMSALLKIDNNVLKLDAGTDTTFQLINRPASPIHIEQIVDNLVKLDGKLIIQTLFLRGKSGDKIIDNTTQEEVDKWLEHLVKIKPSLVMLYSISRETAEDGLTKVSRDELEAIAERVRLLGIETEVY